MRGHLTKKKKKKRQSTVSNSKFTAVLPLSKFNSIKIMRPTGQKGHYY